MRAFDATTECKIQLWAFATDVVCVPTFDVCEKCVERNQVPLQNFHDKAHLFYRLSEEPPQFLRFPYPILVDRSTAVHTGICCPGCQTEDPSQGYLCKYQECRSSNLCEACESKGVHDPNHARTKLATPTRSRI
jgi:hypothetical protein